LDLLGDPLAALLLNQIVYLTGRCHDLDRFLAEEEARQKGPLPYGAPVFGWLHKSDAELARDTMIGSRPTINRLMHRLAREGYILMESNSGSKRRFRLLLVELIEALQQRGWPAYVVDREPVQ